MKERVVAKRYAKAIFELAVEAKELDAVARGIGQLAEVAEELPAFLKGLSDERLEVPRRVAAAGSIAAAMKLSPTAGHALQLIVARGRAGILPLIARDFERRAARAAKLTAATACVADAGVAADVRVRLEKILSEALGTSARCEVTVDEALIGGFALQVGDVRYDASYQGKLERMKAALR